MLSYCTNVHPAEDLAGVCAQLARYAAPARVELGVDTLGVGLWLAADLAEQLATDHAALRRLRSELDAHGLAAVTLNAFPYRGFHDPVVKHRVYEPRWTEPDRLRYTLHCAEVLAELLPEGGRGSISTLPLGWREPWSAHDEAAARRHLDEAAAQLRTLAGRTGRRIRLAIEPEPGCLLDNVADALGWLPGCDTDHIGLCLDTCHLAVSFADPTATVRAIADSGIDIVKVQASAALHVDDPVAARAELARYAEPRYLHQVRERAADGIRSADDLPQAFDQLPGTGPWRVHFHVPVHWAADSALRPTTDVLRDVVAALLDPRPDIEVETYTWNVLPEQPDDLADGIAAELAFTQRLLDTLEAP
ncbi:metabolite traffic protein EboE [Saccharopolyspora sp. K220]|uniref:metabolite traffic protein EboE n=1 Tax=Saccharopolyspora soli TaxID=2926618 RepID=UPI001F5AD0DD|nr:metabolite traffic protein EboE [Saccharopolyspora soli]MCI2416913.1 metabolite traffic protein EboE [Saccharopolyspora soli]